MHIFCVLFEDPLCAFFWDSSVVAAGLVKLARYIGTPATQELVREPRYGLWDVDNALLMTLKINSFSVIL